MSKLESLVYTNEKCIGCNKCINVCPAMGACTSVDVDGNERRISVNGTYCVSCGACMDACVHGAREFHDDTERFFADLKAGQKISLLLSSCPRSDSRAELSQRARTLKLRSTARHTRATATP